MHAYLWQLTTIEKCTLTFGNTSFMSIKFWLTCKGKQSSRESMTLTRYLFLSGHSRRGRRLLPRAVAVGAGGGEVRAAVDQGREPLQPRAVPGVHQAPEEVRRGHREVAAAAAASQRVHGDRRHHYCGTTQVRGGGGRLEEG
jgi:hypothetical protein